MVTREKIKVGLRYLSEGELDKFKRIHTKPMQPLMGQSFEDISNYILEKDLPNAWRLIENTLNKRIKRLSYDELVEGADFKTILVRGITLNANSWGSSDYIYKWLISLNYKNLLFNNDCYILEIDIENQSFREHSYDEKKEYKEVTLIDMVAYINYTNPDFITSLNGTKFERDNTDKGSISKNTVPLVTKQLKDLFKQQKNIHNNIQNQYNHYNQKSKINIVDYSSVLGDLDDGYSSLYDRFYEK